MTDWSERHVGFCSANPDAALVCLVDRIVSVSQSVSQKETTSRRSGGGWWWDAPL